MKHFTPVLPPRETAKNARAFVKENMDIFWVILKPLLPFIVGFELLNVFIDHYLFADGTKQLGIGSLIGSYFLGAFMISWHRVVIHGPDRYVPMNPFKPKKNELAFIFLPMGLVFLYALITGLLFALSARFGGAAPAIIILAVFLVFGMFAFFKISFYLPAKAVDVNITLRQSWNVTTGYVWKLLAAGFLSSWRIFVVVILIGAASGGVSGVFFNIETINFRLMMFIFMLPIVAYASPLVTAIGVTVLSNYFQWASNKPLNIP